MGMQLLDWLVVAAYVLFALAVGLAFAKRAGKDVDQFFLSGRSLPWWLAGTSMVATSFAADTPLVVTKWVRDDGIWKNWLWWSFAISGMLSVFLFSRWWRRAQVMTKAELVEVRYSGKEAQVLRASLGVFHAALTNTITLCWVLLAAAKIMDVLFGVDKLTALVLACAISLAYTLLAGFWGVVITDLAQFVMAAVGAVVLAMLAWDQLGGQTGLAAAQADGFLGPDTLSFFPSNGTASLFDIGSWTIPFATVATYLGVYWWAVENVDGSTVTVQRISASRNERDGLLATLWYIVLHYAFRPWPWIIVAIASLVLLPTIEVRAGHPGKIVESSTSGVVIAASDGAGRVEVPLVEGYEPDWHPELTVKVGDRVEAGDVIADTDSERAYVVMMLRLLPIGLLGLVVASLLAAFMSTIDTHVNLAASFFVNDVYRRFIKTDGDASHYVVVARFACFGVLVLGGTLAWQSKSISNLFMFFLSFLGGVGPVYVLRWLWWRIRASTEITAMVASSVSAIAIHFGDFIPWPDLPLSPGGVISDEGRQCAVVLFSVGCAMISMLFTARPDPRSLVEFYRRVRPIGWWGPVRALAPDVEPPREVAPALIGSLSGLAATFGLMFAIGQYVLGETSLAVVSTAVAAVGTCGVVWSLRRLIPRAQPG